MDRVSIGHLLCQPVNRSLLLESSRIPTSLPNWSVSGTPWKSVDSGTCLGILYSLRVIQTHQGHRHDHQSSGPSTPPLQLRAACFIVSGAGVMRLATRVTPGVLGT